MRKLISGEIIIAQLKVCGLGGEKLILINRKSYIINLTIRDV